MPPKCVHNSQLYILVHVIFLSTSLGCQTGWLSGLKCPAVSTAMCWNPAQVKWMSNLPAWYGQVAWSLWINVRECLLLYNSLYACFIRNECNTELMFTVAHSNKNTINYRNKMEFVVACRLNKRETTKKGGKLRRKINPDEPSGQ